LTLFSKIYIFKRHFVLVLGIYISRFTCWCQQTNNRYDNIGVRIDYTLIDKALLPFVCKGHVSSLRCGIDQNEPICPNENKQWEENSLTEQRGTPTIPKEDDANPILDFALSEEAALRAATANGAFQGASFLGGGIASASRKILDTQFGPPHSGIVYTPPSYSDHVGVSLLLTQEPTFNNDNESKNGNKKHSFQDENEDTTRMMKLVQNEFILNDKDAKTKKSQPFKAQKSIMNYFSPNSTNSKPGPPSSSQKRKQDFDKQRLVTKETKRNTLHSFFFKTKNERLQK